MVKRADRLIDRLATLPDDVREMVLHWVKQINSATKIQAVVRGWLGRPLRTTRIFYYPNDPYPVHNNFWRSVIGYRLDLD